jgi:hypothetical protein
MELLSLKAFGGPSRSCAAPSLLSVNKNSSWREKRITIRNSETQREVEITTWWEKMASEKVETIVAGNYMEMEREGDQESRSQSKISKYFWQGGSVYDAWFSCASNQVHTIAPCTVHNTSAFVSNCFTLFSYMAGLVCVLLCVVRVLAVSYDVVCWINAGGTSAPDAAVLVLATGDDVGDFVPAVLWNHGELDRVSD